jgi:hypothetical protein
MHLAIIVDIAANGESGGAELLVIVCDLVAPCYWHVVDHPLLHVVFMNPLLKKLEFLSISLVVASVHVSFVAKNNGIFHILSESHLQREPTHEVHLHTAEGGRVTHIVGRGPDPLSKHNLAKILHRVPVCRVFIHFTEIKTRELDMRTQTCNMGTTEQGTVDLRSHLLYSYGTIVSVESNLLTCTNTRLYREAT